MVRLFIALPVPAAVKDELRQVQAELSERMSDDSVRWTTPKQMHLTLRFLGEVVRSQVEDLTGAVREVGRQFPPLHLRAQGVGFFPNPRFPRVIWAGVHDIEGQLQLLQAAVSEASARFTDEEAEKNFTGHLTLGRVRNPKPTQAEALAEWARGIGERIFGEWRADTVEIMRSEPSAHGSEYTSMASIRLVVE
ncbi:MAG: 2-5 ligase [Pedosphaera sp.]|nr:2-5 ligase [Pedosphaera sp.]